MADRWEVREETEGGQAAARGGETDRHGQRLSVGELSSACTDAAWGLGGDGSGGGARSLATKGLGTEFVQREVGGMGSWTGGAGQGHWDLGGRSLHLSRDPGARLWISSWAP